MTNAERHIELGKLVTERKQIISDLAIAKTRITNHIENMRKAIECCNSVLEEKYEASCWDISFLSPEDLKKEFSDLKKKTERIKEIEPAIGIKS